MKINDLYKPLIESREAPLYHWVDDEKLKNILQTDAMGAWWEHILPDGRKVYGNSLSRNKRFSYPKTNKIARLVFDQSKLSQTNKIIPLDAEVIYDNTHGGAGIDNIVSDRQKAKKSSHDTDYQFSEYNIMAEEFVVGNISPLHKYLLAIDVNHRETRMIELAQRYGKKYMIPVNVDTTPKIY